MDRIQSLTRSHECEVLQVRACLQQKNWHSYVCEDRLSQLQTMLGTRRAELTGLHKLLRERMEYYQQREREVLSLSEQNQLRSAELEQSNRAGFELTLGVSRADDELLKAQEEGREVKRQQMDCRRRLEHLQGVRKDLQNRVSEARAELQVVTHITLITP